MLKFFTTALLALSITGCDSIESLKPYYGTFADQDGGRLVISKSGIQYTSKNQKLSAPVTIRGGWDETYSGIIGNQPGIYFTPKAYDSSFAFQSYTFDMPNGPYGNDFPSKTEVNVGVVFKSTVVLVPKDDETNECAQYKGAIYSLSLTVDKTVKTAVREFSAMLGAVDVHATPSEGCAVGKSIDLVGEDSISTMDFLRE